ncbi:MAG: GH25 family lysozyme [Sporolactobacillus sp.]
MTRIEGIDVSHFQGGIDFARVKAAGYQFVIVKATEGKTYADPNYRNNIVNARAAGLAAHAYHYFHAKTETDARLEADWLLKNLTGMEGYLFCDVEEKLLDSSPGQLTRFVNTFFDQLAKANRTLLGIYSNKDFFEQRLDESSLRPGLLRWIARYNTQLGREADIWQYTSHATVQGIDGPVDSNIAYTELVVNNSQSTKDVKTIHPAPKKPAAIPSSIVPYPGHVLKQGSKGKDVERIQRAVKVKADGIYGPITKAAVQSYQKRHGLAVDGIVGPKTWAVMF